MEKPYKKLKDYKFPTNKEMLKAIKLEIKGKW